MRKIKALLAVLLAVVMMLTVFTGCSKSGDDEKNPTTAEESADKKVELGDTVDGEYTVIEIDEANGIYTAVKLDSPDAYRLHTYTEGFVYDLESGKQIRTVSYERDADNNPVKVTYTDIESDTVFAVEEYTYTDDGKLLTFSKRNEKGISVEASSYTYNEDGSYSVDKTEAGRLVQSAQYDKNGNITRMDEYKYEDDGSYSVKSFDEDRLVKFVSFAADGSETERHEYNYEDDGSFKEDIYRGNNLIEEVTHASDEAETRTAEPSSNAERATLAADAKIEKQTAAEEEKPTKKTETPTKKSGGNTDTPVSQEIPTLPERKETSKDMLKESRIYRSGNFYLAGTMTDTDEVGQFELALSPNTSYASAQMDLSDLLGMDGMGVADMALLATADGKYYILEGVNKVYCEMDSAFMSMMEIDDPKEMFAELDFRNAMLNIDESAEPTKTESTTVNGEAVTCYTFTAEDGSLSKHYVNKDGQLIRIEDCSTTGTVLTTVDIAFISSDIPENRKNVPSDYTSKDVMSFMMSMLEGALGEEE